MSNPHSGSNRNGSGVYESKVSFAEKEPQPRNKAMSRNHLQSEPGDIPVMPVMQNSDKISNVHSPNSHYYQQHSSPPRNNHRSSAGNIPLLELSQEELRKEQKKRVKSKHPLKKDDREK